MREPKMRSARYQKSKGIYPSGNLDQLTSFALSVDDSLLNKRVVGTGLYTFFAEMWDQYFSADGAWDYQNRSEYTVQSSHIECEPKLHLCRESDAILISNVSLGVVTKDYAITRWDDYRILAEFVDRPCEKDELDIIRDTQQVTLHMIDVDKSNPKCKDLLGDETTIDAHLIGGGKLEAQRMQDLGKKREALFQYSDSAKKILAVSR